MSKLERPYTICHMMASVDGRIDCAMTEKIESGNEYYEALDELDKKVLQTKYFEI